MRTILYLSNSCSKFIYMCKVYNTTGALTSIKTHLQQNNVDGFNSIQDLLRFQKEYPFVREHLLSTQRDLLTEERNKLSAGILKLEEDLLREKNTLEQKFKAEIQTLQQQYDALSEAEKTIIQEFTYSFKALFKLLRITYLKWFADKTVTRTVKPKVNLLEHKRNRFNYLVAHFEEAVTVNGRYAAQELDRKKRIIDEINSYIYGAIGEQKVVDELNQLSDDYTLINDFTYTFDRPLFHKQQRTQIKTIQVDHLLVSPAGVFLIETKNWSRESVQSLSLRSPVAQIQRTSFALFILINRTADFKLVPHHWGERKIPIRNLIVLMNHKPKEEFDYVKILDLKELVRYVNYFKPTLSQQETKEIADYLVTLKT